MIHLARLGSKPKKCGIKDHFASKMPTMLRICKKSFRASCSSTTITWHSFSHTVPATSVAARSEPHVRRFLAIHFLATEDGPMRFLFQPTLVAHVQGRIRSTFFLVQFKRSHFSLPLESPTFSCSGSRAGSAPWQSTSESGSELPSEPLITTAETVLSFGHCISRPRAITINNCTDRNHSCGKSQFHFDAGQCVHNSTEPSRSDSTTA